MNNEEPLELPTMSSLIEQQVENSKGDEESLDSPLTVFDSESFNLTGSAFQGGAPVLNRPSDTEPLDLPKMAF